MTETTTRDLDVDAFPSTDGADAVRRIEDATGASSGDALGYESVSLAATLQDAKVSKAQNGDNYDLKFEVDIEGFVRLAVEGARGKGSYAVTWKQIHVGNGAEIKSLGSSRDADGAMHYRVGIHLPQSEISRSLGKVGIMLGVSAKLLLEPEQGTLGLESGQQVDLTQRAEPVEAEPHEDA